MQSTQDSVWDTIDTQQTLVPFLLNLLLQKVEWYCSWVKKGECRIQIPTWKTVAKIYWAPLVDVKCTTIITSTMYTLSHQMLTRRLRIQEVGNSLAVQRLGLGAFTAVGPGSIPGQGTKILHAAYCVQKKKKSKYIYICSYFLGVFWWVAYPCLLMLSYNSSCTLLLYICLSHWIVIICTCLHLSEWAIERHTPFFFTQYQEHSWCSTKDCWLTEWNLGVW